MKTNFSLHFYVQSHLFSCAVVVGGCAAPLDPLAPLQSDVSVLSGVESLEDMAPIVVVVFLVVQDEEDWRPSPAVCILGRL